MIKYFLFSIQLLFFFAIAIYSQEKILVPSENIITVRSEFESKVASSEVFRLLNEKAQRKLQKTNNVSEDLNTVLLNLYFEEKPSFDKIQILENSGIKVYPNTWIPPLENHPLGFLIAKVPIDKVDTLLSNSFVLKISSAETVFEPNTNTADNSIRANLVWNQGYTGTGVKIAMLDSGLDTDPTNPDLPLTFIKRDYSNYPTSIDDIVENTVTGHGTHTTGIALGRGVLSSSNTGNGGGPYKGSAPNADLVFLKIGSDADGSATTAAIQAAIQAAVDTFNANVISMSFGGWYDHHDGSSTIEQLVDWAYSRGVPVFLSAGNEGNTGRHYTGTVPANSTTGNIQINVTGATASSTALYFNLVWADGSSRNNLSLRFYNSSNTLQSSTGLTTTESSRGTESKYSYMNNFVPAGNSTWYLRVTNPSNVDQTFHIYEVWNDGKVKFNSPDPNYTVGQPSSADHGFSCGAYTSRTSWTASDGNIYNFVGSGSLNAIAPFSSRGPRIDGLTKPNIVAPGTAIISIRDRDYYTTSSPLWVDNDGVFGGDANYIVNQGTSMSAPITAGAAALILQRYPNLTPLQIYTALQNNSLVDGNTGAVPNNTWGYGKLDIFAAINDQALPVELSSFSASVVGNAVKLNWKTETEVNNYGFDIERSLPQPLPKEGAFGTPLPLGKGQGDGLWTKIGFVNGNGNSNSPKSYSFEDKSVLSGKYSYRLKQIDNDGQFEYSKTIEVDLGAPKKFELSQNYPNPFNPTTTIRFSLPDASLNPSQGGTLVKLTVYNVLGQQVAVLVNDILEAGVHTINFNASELNSGIYIYKLEAGSFVQTRKMTLIK